ncbi:MAG: universal stress protein [Nitrososphaerales archaeon]
MLVSKILVAIDGSETSDYALNMAIKFGEPNTSTVDLLHIIGGSALVSSTPVFDPSLGTSAVVTPQVSPSGVDSDAGKKDLLEDRRKLVTAQHLNCNAISVRSDDVSGEILKTISSGKYDLVVLGSRGLGGIKGFILGSVSQKVAKEAKISVLIVKAKIEGTPKILLGYDGSPDSKRALESTVMVCKKFKAAVTAATVVNLPITTEGYMASTIDKWDREARAQVEEAVNDLKENGIEASAKVLDHVDIARGLAEEAEKNSYDLIIIGNRGLGKLKSLFLGSVASGVANNAKTNVLIVR